MQKWQSLAVLMALCILGAPRASAQLTIIEGATVITGDAATPIPDAVLVIDGSRIRQITKRAGFRPPANAKTINAQGKTIIPGLMTLHGHLGRTEGLEANEEFLNRARIQRDANEYLYYGITQMLSIGHDREAVFAFMADQRAGKVTGARVYTAGLGFGVKGGWPANPYVHRPTTPEEARVMTRAELAKHPHLLKVWVDDRLGHAPQFTPDLYGPIIEEARKAGVKVAAHIYYLDDAKELLRRGISALAHSVQDREVDDEFLQLAKQNHITQVTTLAGIRRPADYADAPAFLSDPGLPLFFSAKTLDTFRSKEYHDGLGKENDLDLIRQQGAMAAKNAKKIAAAGIPLAVGTDSGLIGNFAGLWEHRELALLVEAGITPIQAIQAATINPARFLGIDRDYGSIAAGKVADFLVLNADPLADIRNSLRIETIWMNGKPVDRSALAAVHPSQ